MTLASLMATIWKFIIFVVSPLILIRKAVDLAVTRFLSHQQVHVRSRSRSKNRSSSQKPVKTDADSQEIIEAKAIADALVTRGSTAARKAAGTNTSPKPRRSVRIKLHSQADSILKSPTSGSLSPDIAKSARRKATLSRAASEVKPTKKTLILDLDETLIHSLSKGGTMSGAHMIEVKLGSHAILYHVHKRPHCDHFLTTVAMWFDIVIFTASVQEYADPVIDWLEQERKFFKARYYRQHCTFRNGAYMKDLSLVEPDLSKAIIVDNSPLSYRLNEANAVPIEGWISDPSDNDLLYLIPLLYGLRAVGDVRSLLSLRAVG